MADGGRLWWIVVESATTVANERKKEVAKKWEADTLNDEWVVSEGGVEDEE